MIYRFWLLTVVIVAAAGCDSDTLEVDEMSLGSAGRGEARDGGNREDSQDPGDRDDPGEDDPAESDAAVRDAGATDPDPAPFDAVYEILAANCAGSICHIEQDSGGLAMPDAESAYRALLEGRGSCDAPRVVPEDPEASLLIQKLEGDPECGLAMPLGRDPLPTQDIQTIRDWIELGAPAP